MTIRKTHSAFINYSRPTLEWKGGVRV